MNELLERAEGLEDAYSRMVEMRQNVEKELRTSTGFPIVSERAMEWKSAAETLLGEMESLQDEGGKDQGRALAKIRLHVCLSTIYSDLKRIYDEGSQNVHSRHKKKPARIKSIQDTLLSIVDASEDYDDEELQLDAVEALAILHGVSCYFEDLSKALIASFSFYPTKDKGIIFLESIEEQDVNNIFISTSNWANIAPELVHLEMDWCQRWYPEYARIYFWLVENAGIEKIELARQEPSNSWPAPVVPPQRFHRALQLGEETR